MSNSDVLQEIQEKRGQMQAKGGPGKARFQYVDHPDFEAWVVHAEDSGKCYRVAFPTAKLFENGTRECACWTMETLIDYFQPTLRSYYGAYGGRWVLEIRKPVRSAQGQTV